MALDEGDAIFNPMPSTRFILRVIVLGAGVLLFLGFALLLGNFFLPQVYFAKVMIEVKRDDSGAIVVFGGRHQLHEQQFITRQIAILQSKEILNQVIRNLSLDVAWAKDGQALSMERVYLQLVNYLEIRDLSGQGMIEIGVYANDPQEAANIANTVAVVYQQRRLADFERRIERDMEQLKEEREKQRQRAVDAVVEVAKIREKDGIIDSDPDGFGISIGSIKGEGRLDAYRDAKTQALLAKRIYEAVNTRYVTELNTHVEFSPTKVWEKAEPSIGPIGFSLRRFSHAFPR